MVRCKTIAPKYGVTPKTIRDIWRGRTWIQATEHLWTEEEKIQRAQGDSSSSDDEDGNDARPSASARSATSNPPQASAAGRGDAHSANARSPAAPTAPAVPAAPAAPSIWAAASNAQGPTPQTQLQQAQLHMHMQAHQQSQMQAQFQAQQAQLQAQLQMQVQGQLLAQLQMHRQCQARAAPAAGEWPGAPAAGAADGGAHLVSPPYDAFNAPAARSAAAAACGSWPPAATAGWRPDPATMSALAALSGGGSSSCPGTGGAWGAFGDATGGADRACGAGRLFPPLDAPLRDGAWHRAVSVPPCGAGGDGWPAWGGQGQGSRPLLGQEAAQWGGLRF
jgi:hypothetical protein